MMDELFYFLEHLVSTPMMGKGNLGLKEKVSQTICAPVLLSFPGLLHYQYWVLQA